jgi:hypothetical protein
LTLGPDGPRLNRISYGSLFLVEFVWEPTYNWYRPPHYIDEGVLWLRPPQSIESNLFIKFTLFALFFPYLRSMSN